MKEIDYGPVPPKYPHDRALGNVILTNGSGKYFAFGAFTLKEKLENMAHYSVYGFPWRLP